MLVSCTTRLARGTKTPQHSRVMRAVTNHFSFSPQACKSTSVHGTQWSPVPTKVLIVHYRVNNRAQAVCIIGVGNGCLGPA